MDLQKGSGLLTGVWTPVSVSYRENRDDGEGELVKQVR